MAQNWDWLKARKKQEQYRKMNMQPAMASNSMIMPVGQRYNVGAQLPNDTGYGEDGKLQTNMPVAMYNTANGGQAMVHEGERLKNQGNGNIQVVSQAQLLEEEKRRTMPGYGCGGNMRLYKGGGTFKTYQDGGIMRRQATGTPPMPKPNVQPPQQPKPNVQPPQGPAQPAGGVAGRKVGGGGSQPKPRPTAPTPGGPDGWWKNPWQNKHGKITPNKVDPAPGLPNLNPDGPIINPDIQGQGGITPGNITGDITGPDEVTPDNLNNVTPRPHGDIAPTPVGPPKPVPQPDPDFQEGEKQDWLPKPAPPPDPDSEYEQDFQDAIGRIDQMGGGYEKERQKYLDQLAAQKATEQLVGAQRSAQRGVGGVEAATAGLMQERMANQAISGAYADTAIGAMKIAEQANLEKAKFAMQGMQYETAKEQWQKQFGLSEKQWEDTFGLDEKQFEESKRQWQQQMDFAEKQYGDQAGSRIADLVNQGHSLEYIQSQYPDANITQEDYDQMQEWSPTGFMHEQWDYQKKVDSFNMLLQQGGADNYKAAQDLAEEMFGVDVDFSNALAEENKEKFNGAWNNMIGAISSNMSFEDWKKVAEKSGEYEKLNMTDEDIEEMYGNMQLQNNPIYQSMQQYDKLLEEGVIDQDGYDRIMDALTHGLSHPEGFTFSDGYGVYDEQGNEVGMFESEEEAQEFMNNNPDMNYEMKIDEDGIVKYTGGESGDGPDGPDPDPDEITDEQWNDMDEGEQNDYFLETLPLGIMETWEGEDGYNKWVDAGKPRTYDAYLESLEGGIMDFTKTLQDKYGEEGWAAITNVSESMKGKIKAGRKKFISGGEGLTSIGKDEWENTRFDDFVTSDKFKSGNVISIDGQNPMVITSDLSQMGPENKFIVAHDLVTGKKIIIGRAFGGGIELGNDPSKYA